MFRPLRLWLLLALPLLAACPGGMECTLIGCANQLTLHVVGADGPGLSGSVTLGGHTFSVDCDGESDPEVVCSDGDISIQLSDAQGGGEVTWTLSTDDTDTATGGGNYVGNGTFTPDWTSSSPNGPDCGSTCWSGEGTVELYGTP